MTTLFRPHKGSLAQAMKEVKSVSSKQELVTLIKRELSQYKHDLLINEQTIHIEHYSYDERIDWNTHIVTLKDYGVLGFTNAPL